MKNMEEAALPDPRHYPIVQYISMVYSQNNDGLKVPWDGRTAKALQHVLRSCPSWTVETFRRCIDNRFKSEMVNVSAHPLEWLDGKEKIVSYARSPLDSFKRPKFQRISQEEQIQRYWDARAKEMN